MNQKFILLLGIVSACYAQLSFTKQFTVEINDNLQISYDGKNERAIISEENTTSVFYCGCDGFIEYYIKDKQESKCKHGLSYACGLMDYYVKEWLPVRPLLDNIPNNAKIVENTTCSYYGENVLCSYWQYDLLSCQDNSYVLWNVLNLDKNNYFPTSYFKKNSRATRNDCVQDIKLYFYNLVNLSGPSNKDINDWIKNNC